MYHYRASNSFFKTERGQHSIQTALNMAFAHMLASQRCFDVTFSVPFKEASHLTLKDSIIVHIPFLGGKVIGKITSMTFSESFASGAIATFRVGVCAPHNLFLPKGSEILEKNEAYFHMQKDEKTPYFLEKWLKHVEVENDGYAQEKLIENCETSAEAEYILNENPTVVTLSFSDMKEASETTTIHLGDIKV